MRTWVWAIAPIGGAALASALACGGGQTGSGLFSASWTDDGGRSIATLQQKLAKTGVPLGADVAVGVAGHGSKLLGLPLAGGPRWTFAHAIDARPVVAGGVVVATGAAEVFALDALTGRLLWTRTTGGLALHGAGDDGTITVVTMSSATGRGSSLLAIAHDGSVLRQIDAPVLLGAPAVVSRLAFVPWDNQYVTVLDVTDGSEAGRVLLREKTSQAWAVGGAIYFGEIGLFRFDEKIKDASRGGADHLALPAKVLPGHPVLMRPGDDAPHASAGAADKVRLYARPTGPGEPLAFDSDRFYATYFRLAFGLSGERGNVAWVYTHPSTFIAGAAAKGSLVLCDETGKLTTLEAKHGGQIGDPQDLGEPLESCVVQADGFQKSGSVSDPGPLMKQIRVALSDRDLELGAGQGMLLHDLGAVADEEGTELLLAIANDPHTAPPVLTEVRASLASRRTGARYLIAALAKHYDFLHDVLVPPPVGPLARALAAMNAPGSAPVLTGHLFDPADTNEDVRDVAQALRTLATPAETAALLRFFALYRDAPAEPEEIPDAVNAVGEALLRVGGKEGRGAIDAALRQPGTNPTVRAKLSALLDASAAQPETPSTRPSSTSRE